MNMIKIININMNSALLKGLILHLCKVKINPETDSNTQLFLSNRKLYRAHKWYT